MWLLIWLHPWAKSVYVASRRTFTSNKAMARRQLADSSTTLHTLCKIARRQLLDLFLGSEHSLAPAAHPKMAAVVPGVHECHGNVW